MVGLITAYLGGFQIIILCGSGSTIEHRFILFPDVEMCVQGESEHTVNVYSFIRVRLSTLVGVCCLFYGSYSPEVCAGSKSCCDSEEDDDVPSNRVNDEFPNCTHFTSKSPCLTIHYLSPSTTSSHRPCLY